MHRYLRTIGFSEYNTNKKIRELRDEVISSPTKKEIVSIGENEFYFCYEKDYGECFGIIVIKIGENEEDSDVDSMFPYLRGYNYLFNERFDINPCSDHKGYYGYCDDNNLGIPMIFSLNNPIDFHTIIEKSKDLERINCVTLSGLAIDGKILLPIEKSESQAKTEKKKNEKRNNMINAAKSGDVSAMERLTLEDMNTFTCVNLRSKTEDIMTIVSSYFMPYTVECDKYSVLGEIKDVAELKNKMTGEEMYYMSLICNSIEFEVMINKKDLLGIPQKGRRWKGHLWMQGQMDCL